VAFLHTPSSCLEGRQANKLWIRFLYDGTRINEDDTPGSLDMDDNGMVFFSYKILYCLIHFPDTIDVMVERTYRNATSMFNAVADSPISTEVGGSNVRFRVRPTP
jgi:hypothetical protein